MKFIRVVHEFMDVFPIVLPGIPPNHCIDFAIDIEPSAKVFLTLLIG